MIAEPLIALVGLAEGVAFATAQLIGKETEESEHDILYQPVGVYPRAVGHPISAVATVKLIAERLALNADHGEFHGKDR